MVAQKAEAVTPTDIQRIHSFILQQQPAIEVTDVDARNESGRNDQLDVNASK
jgi:hypothetical protein